MPARNTMRDSISSGRCVRQSAGRHNWATNSRLKLSSNRSTWTNSRLPLGPMWDSSRRRSVPNSSGRAQPCNGAAWSRALGFRSSSSR